MSQINSGLKPYPFSLYLRSFDTDAALMYAPDDIPLTWRRFIWTRLLGLSRVVRFWTFFPERSAAVEAVMADALWGWRPLIALGNRDELRGPGYISVLDSQWAGIFQSLASKATIILLLPGESRGTMAEIHWLMQSRATEKLLLLKPKRNKGYDLWWDKVQEACLQHDLHLSALNEEYEILRISDLNQTVVTTSLGKFKAKKIRLVLRSR